MKRCSSPSSDRPSTSCRTLAGWMCPTGTADQFSTNILPRTHAIDPPRTAVVERQHVRPAGIDRSGLLVALIGAEHGGQLIRAQQYLVAVLQDVAQHLGREVVGGEPDLGGWLGLLAAVVFRQGLPSLVLLDVFRHRLLMFLA